MLMSGKLVYVLFSRSLLLSSTVFLVISGLVGVLGCEIFVEWVLFSINSAAISGCFFFDLTSLVFLSVVSLISGCVMNYSKYYMNTEINYLRFSYLVMLFVGSMMAMILSPNLVSLLLGWDGLGLTSYGLVIFYQTELSSGAGMLTVLSNRIGDVAILLGIGCSVWLGSWNYLFWGLEGNTNLVLFLVVLAGCTKSAQVPFSAWLPAAMAAPTPVSALVHSSTLVTAGVYLIFRFNEVLVVNGSYNYLLITGVLTMITAGLSANLEMDMKKVIALSTLSQLGLMMVALSLGLKELAFFHLVCHAMFKSLLFMCAGVLIHTDGTQDGRGLSCFTNGSPSISMGLGVSNLALLGFPFMSGYFSKDFLLEGVLSSEVSFVCLVLVVVGASLTVSYSFRLVYLSGCYDAKCSSVSSVSGISNIVMKSGSVLTMFSVVLGASLSWCFFSGSAGFVLTSVSKFSLIFMMVVFGVLGSHYCVSKVSEHGVVTSGVVLMWFLPELSRSFSSGVLSLSQKGCKQVEAGWFEYYGGDGLNSSFKTASSLVQESQSSTLVFSCLMCALVLIFWLN